MTATLMKGKPLADRIRAEVAEEVRALGHVGLVTVLVGDDPASEVYIRLKHKAATEAGFDATDLRGAAVGVPALVSPDMVKERAVVVDVGMNRTDAGLVGDVDPGALDVAAYMTPVPGGVGPMTIACLLENAVRCGRYRRGELAYPG